MIWAALFLSQDRRVASRQTPYSFVAPQKSKQKRAPDLLALRVPCTAGMQGALAKLAYGSNIPRLTALNPFRSGCVTREGNFKTPLLLPEWIRAFGRFAATLNLI